MNKISKIGIVAGIAFVVAMSGMILSGSFNSGNIAGKDEEKSPIPEATAQAVCLSDADAMAKASPAIRENLKRPEKLPDNYAFVCAQAGPYDATLLYWNQTIASDTSLQRQDMIEHGAISVSVALEDRTVDPAYDVRNKTAEILAIYKELKPEHNPQLVMIGGNIAVVREQCDSCGVQVATFEDGKQIRNTYPLPTFIQFFDGDYVYVIEGNLPSSELIPMAQSMK